jgi:hypothetical protein
MEKMLFKTNNDIEKYMKNIIGIPSVDFTGIDITISNQFIDAINIMLEKYPDLKNAICSISTASNIKKQLKTMIQDNNLDCEFKKKALDMIEEISNNDETSPMSCLYIPIKNKKPYIALCFEPFLTRCNLEMLINKIKKTIDYTCDPEVVIYHEVGHILDRLLDLSFGVEFFRLIKEEYGDKEIPYYVFRDFYAEAFGEYYTSLKPTVFSEKTVELTDNVYRKKFGKGIIM